MQFLLSLFWPRPDTPEYSSPKVILLLLLCLLLVVGSFAIRYWRGKLTNPMTKKLSASWPMALLWFGIIGFVLVIARTEGIQFIAMPFLWVVWGLCLLFYAAIQIRLFRARHYEVLPSERVMDPRDRYLPGKRKR